MGQTKSNPLVVLRQNCVWRCWDMHAHWHKSQIVLYLVSSRQRNTEGNSSAVMSFPQLQWVPQDRPRVLPIWHRERRAYSRAFTNQKAPRKFEEAIKWPVLKLELEKTIGRARAKTAPAYTEQSDFGTRRWNSWYSASIGQRLLDNHNRDCCQEFV